MSRRSPLQHHAAGQRLPPGPQLARGPHGRGSVVTDSEGDRPRGPGAARRSVGPQHRLELARVAGRSGATRGAAIGPRSPRGGPRVGFRSSRRAWGGGSVRLLGSRRAATAYVVRGMGSRSAGPCDMGGGREHRLALLLWHGGVRRVTVGGCLPLGQPVAVAAKCGPVIKGAPRSAGALRTQRVQGGSARARSGPVSSAARRLLPGAQCGHQPVVGGLPGRRTLRRGGELQSDRFTSAGTEVPARHGRGMFTSRAASSCGRKVRSRG